jgi:hypothetical protein
MHICVYAHMRVRIGEGRRAKEQKKGQEGEEKRGYKGDIHANEQYAQANLQLATYMHNTTCTQHTHYLTTPIFYTIYPTYAPNMHHMHEANLQLAT